MKLMHLTAAVAVLSLFAAPALAASPSTGANPAAKLSLAKATDVRAGAPMKRSNKAVGSTVLLVGVGVAAVVTAAILLGNGGHDNMPASH